MRPVRGARQAGLPGLRLRGPPLPQQSGAAEVGDHAQLRAAAIEVSQIDDDLKEQEAVPDDVPFAMPEEVWERAWHGNWGPKLGPQMAAKAGNVFRSPDRRAPPKVPGDFGLTCPGQGGPGDFGLTCPGRAPQSARGFGPDVSGPGGAQRGEG